MKSFLRQRDIFVPDPDTVISIIGAGGIGSWVALGLSKTGFEHIDVWDGDIIEDHNIPNQIFLNSGLSKADELANTVPSVTAIHKFWEGEKIISDIIVIGVDNMDTRKQIIETQRASLIIDGRIGGELIRVLSVSPIDYGSKDYYLRSWYPSSDAVELPCTARSISYVGFFVSAIICKLICQFLKENKIVREVILDANKLEILKIGK